jgi:threonine/homoserine/homoserine lactone efflux protein
MFDAQYRNFAILSATLVLSPGASLAVVMETAIQRGRWAGVLAVTGVNIGNSTLALASMLGLSALLHQWPSLLEVVRIGGALYLTFLGIRAVIPRKQGAPVVARGRSAVSRGVVTNLLHPSVILFYTLILPQFIRATDPFYRRFLLLAITHVSMSFLWLSACALAVGTLSERLAHPRFRRIMELITGGALLYLGLNLVGVAPR